MEPVSWVHAGRLRAASRELLQLLEQVRAITGGQPGPPAAETAYAPLPPERGAPLAAALEGLTERARQVAALAGPPEPAKRPGEAAARAAASARLARFEETLRDLYPDRLQEKYGDLPPAVAAELRVLCAEMTALLAQARAALTAA